MKAQAVTVTVEAPAPPTDVRHERRRAQPARAGLLPLIMASSKRHAAASQAQRRAVPISAYIGANGSGKTLAMVNDTLPSLDRGREVYSTVPLYDDKTGQLHEQYRPFVHWQQLLDARNADFCIDEIVAVAGSRDASSMHTEIQRRFNQLRKHDVVLRWTAPAWRRADLIIREVTIAVTECQGFFTAKQKPDPVTGEIPLWAPRQLFRLRTYDMQSFDEWSAGKRERVDADVKQWFLGPRSRAFEAYRTLDPVETIPPYDTNQCGTCGLQKRRETCKGHDHPASTRG